MTTTSSKQTRRTSAEFTRRDLLGADSREDLRHVQYGVFYVCKNKSRKQDLVSTANLFRQCFSFPSEIFRSQVDFMQCSINVIR